MKLILGGPRTSFAVPRASATGAPLGGAFEPASDAATGLRAQRRLGSAGGPPGKARAERSGARLALGATKEVLVSIALLAFNLDFLGFSLFYHRFPRISIRISIRSHIRISI